MNKLNIDDLCEKYGSDKTPRLRKRYGNVGHSYAPFYDGLLRTKRLTAKRILEIGMGCRDVMKKYIPDYVNCASMYVWRDYFENAIIYGVDSSEECDIEEKRMRIFIGDAMNEELLKKVVADGKFDFILDDASHDLKQQVLTAVFLLEYLEDNGIYVIEDVTQPEVILANLNKYNCEVYTFCYGGDDRLIVITKK